MAVAVDLELTPSLEEVRALARDHSLVPLRHTFIADCETPVSAYLKLRGDGPSFLLESAEQGQRVGRWSFLGFRPRAVIRVEAGDEADPYALVDAELARYRIAQLEGLPPFAGGAVGMFGYDLARSAEPSIGQPNPDETEMPRLAVMVTDLLLAFEDFEIAGASPETLVTVTGRKVIQRPIAGTRPRADSVEQDLEQARGLLADPKERAEHVMLVELEELMAVETYSHVMHIVSQVSGTLRAEVTPMDALRAALPVGTLSGAPKIRAMQIIDELEPTGRGPYGGGVGYLSYTGDLDTCIYIRSALVKDGKVHLQAGGGIVADSDPAYEVRETEAKAGAVMDAVRLACEQGDWA